MPAPPCENEFDTPALLFFPCLCLGGGVVPEGWWGLTPLFSLQRAWAVPPTT